MKLDLNKEMKSWLEILNNNAKWSTAFLIRVVSIVATIVGIFIILKIIGLFGMIKDISKDEKIEIKHDSTKVISKPKISKHKKDLKEIDEIEKIINNRLKTSKDNNNSK